MCSLHRLNSSDAAPDDKIERQVAGDPDRHEAILMKVRVPAIGALLLTLAFSARSQITGAKIGVSRGNLCVTEGAIESGPNNRLSVNAPKMRAYVNSWTSQAIEAHFTYLGVTAEESRLGSGETRQQFGLKLRARNACNLVYAMWRIEPESKIVVSVKRNPGESKSSECGNSGYQNIKPRHTAAVPLVKPGDTHDLSAQMDGEELRVFVDGADVWDGSVEPQAHGLTGPVGVRSDNVWLALELRAGAFVGAHPNYLLSCRSGPDASD
jgi:hypothetical protein